jgi:transposase-like protein
VNTTRHTDSRTDRFEVVVTDQRRRRWSVAEKAALVARTYEPGMSVSLVSRESGVAASMLFAWRKLERQGVLVSRWYLLRSLRLRARRSRSCSACWAK